MDLIEALETGNLEQLLQVPSNRQTNPIIQ